MTQKEKQAVSADITLTLQLKAFFLQHVETEGLELFCKAYVVMQRSKVFYLLSPECYLILT